MSAATIGLSFIIASIMKDSPIVIYGNVRNSHLIDNLPDYLTFVAAFTQSFGTLIAQYNQTSVSFERMLNLLQGAPTERLVSHASLHLRHQPPEILSQPKTENHRLEVV